MHEHTRTRWGLSLLIVFALLASRATAETVSEPVTVVPSTSLPPEVNASRSNNNLDIVRHNDRLYLAFRTAVTHFSSADAAIYVMSTTDQQRWDFEASFAVGRDLREPRFLSWNGRLFFYFSALGVNPAGFEPGQVMVSELQGPRNWTQPQPITIGGAEASDFIAWRTKSIGGAPYMLGYTGGGNTWSLGQPEKEIYLLTTVDGHDWTAVVAGRPVVLRSGCSEADFVFLDDGSLVSACRGETKDDGGYGGKICRAPASALADWTCRTFKRRFDSPLMFRHGDGVYLIARRQVANGGEYDLGLEMIPEDNARYASYQASYSATQKRCELLQVYPGTGNVAPNVSHVLDLPGCGDTCFPAISPASGSTYDVYNYTSDLDVPWLVGQLLPSSIYRVTLTFP